MEPWVFLLGLVKVKDIILAFLCIVVCKSACSSGEKSLLADLSEGGTDSETREERVHGNGKYEDVVDCHLSGTVSFISVGCIGNIMGNRGRTFISRKALVGSSAFFSSTSQQRQTEHPWGTVLTNRPLLVLEKEGGSQVW